MKYILLLILSVFLILSGCSRKKNKVNYIINPADELMENLIQSFDTGTTTVYPEYFGGAYVENGQLSILITDGSTTVKDDIRKRCKGSGFNLILVENTYQQLLFLMERLHVIALDLSKKEIREHIGWNSSYIDEVQNCVSIVLEDVSPENILKFKKHIMDSPELKFVEGRFFFDEEKI